MGTGWRKAFCTSTQRVGEPADKQQSNPSTPRLPSQLISSPRLRCRTLDAASPAHDSPRLRCKTSLSKTPRPQNPGSNPSSPKSPSTFALFKTGLRLSKVNTLSLLCLSIVRRGGVTWSLSDGPECFFFGRTTVGFACRARGLVTDWLSTRPSARTHFTSLASRRKLESSRARYLAPSAAPAGMMFRCSRATNTKREQLVKKRSGSERGRARTIAKCTTTTSRCSLLMVLNSIQFQKKEKTKKKKWENSKDFSWIHPHRPKDEERTVQIRRRSR